MVVKKCFCLSDRVHDSRQGANIISKKNIKAKIFEKIKFVCVSKKFEKIISLIRKKNHSFIVTSENFGKICEKIFSHERLNNLLEFSFWNMVCKITD